MGPMSPMPPMGRYYAKKSTVDYKNILEAIKQVIIHGLSARSVAEQYEMSNATLSRYIRKLNEANLDVSTASVALLLDFLQGISKSGAKAVSFLVFI